MALSPTGALGLTRRLYAKISNRRPDVLRREEYYRGRHPLRFASDVWREFNASRYRNFSDNWCGVVSNAPNERLQVTGIRLDDDPRRSDTERSLWRDWQANDLEVQSSQGFLHSIVTGRSFVLVWGDENGEPIATWERADQAAVEYDPERPGRRLGALKTWCDDDMEFATLYTADEVWKFERKRLEFAEYNSSHSYRELSPRAYAFFVADRNTTISLEDTDGWEPRTGTEPVMFNPIGEVPMVEIQNRPLLGGEPVSEIAGTMAMQDAINLLWAYLFNAADRASMKARVILGQEPPYLPILDADGNKTGEVPLDMKALHDDRILYLQGENTRIDQWDEAKLDVFTNTIEVAVTHIAAQTRTPPHYLVLGKGLVNVSAEGMKTAETGLTSKVREMQLFDGPAVREIFRLMALVRDNKALADAIRFSVIQWRDPENHSEAQLADSLLKLQTIGFPFPWLAERYGLSQPELDRVLAMRETEAAQEPTETAPEDTVAP